MHILASGHAAEPGMVEGRMHVSEYKQARQDFIYYFFFWIDIRCSVTTHVGLADNGCLHQCVGHPPALPPRTA